MGDVRRSAGRAASVLGRGRVGFEAEVMDRLNAAVVVTDLEGRLLYANPFAETTYGWLADTLLGSKVAEMANVDVAPEVVAEIAAALTAGRVWQGEFEVTRPDGARLTVQANDSGLYDDAGQLVGVVSIVTDITEQRESAERLVRETTSLRFLLNVSTVLASSLDFRDCLAKLASLAVPILGDICLIDVWVGDQIVRMAAAHADPSRQPLVDELGEHYPPDPRGAHPAVQVMRTGISTLSPDMTDEFLRATTRDKRHHELVRELGFTSYMCTPLVARGRILGAFTLVSAGSGRRFDGDDLALAEDLGRRAALVLDNARLLSDRTRVARALQDALLPPRLPQVPGLEVGARYIAAGEGNEVGGDLYDLYEVSEGTWVAVVGDVCGTGPEAAAVTGLVRHALRASALRGLDPVAMLRTANRLLHEQSESAPERFCSACCAVIRLQDTVKVDVAAAGHPPPIVVGADAGVTALTCRGDLLGIHTDPVIESQTIELLSGDRLVLYTDGLTEARDPDGLFFGEGRLQEVLASSAALDADRLAGRLAEQAQAYGQGRPRDDLAVLVVGVPAIEPSSRLLRA